jgi:hypothetical protein
MGIMEWFDCFISLGSPGVFDSKWFDAVEDILLIPDEDELLGDNWLHLLLPLKFWMQYISGQI